MKTLFVMIAIGTLLSAVILANPTASFGAPAMKAHQVSGVVIGKQIRASSGVVLGKVENIVLTDGGCVRYVVLSGQFPNARGRLYPIPWDVIARVDREALFVDLDPAVLVQAPSFTAGRWPDFAQAQWDTRVSEFFRSHVHAGVPAGAGAKEQQNLDQQRKLQQQQAPQREMKEKPPVSQQEKMKSHGDMERQRKALEMKKQGPSEQRQMEMMKMRQPGATGEQHGTSTEKSMQKPSGKMMEHAQPGATGQEHKQPGTTGQGNVTPTQPGQGAPHQEREIK
jgi:hypothetical protein